MINNILNIMYPGMCCRPRKICFCGSIEHLNEMKKAAESIRSQLIADVICPHPATTDLSDHLMATAIKHMEDISDADMIIAFANESSDRASNSVLFCQMDWMSGMVDPVFSNAFGFSAQLDEFGFKFDVATVYEIIYAAGNHKPILVIPNTPVLDVNDEVVGHQTRWTGGIPIVRVYDNP